MTSGGKNLLKKFLIRLNHNNRKGKIEKLGQRRGQIRRRLMLNGKKRWRFKIKKTIGTCVLENTKKARSIRAECVSWPSQETTIISIRNNFKRCFEESGQYA
jgi:hypothetical protein